MVAHSSNRAPALALIAMSAWSWISAVSADIRFGPVSTTTPFNPSDQLLLTWTRVANSTDNQPFSLQLRAETGQRFIISNDVPQTLSQYAVTIPKEATGGKVSTTTTTTENNTTPLCDSVAQFFSTSC
jgi:hypothetical protein